MIVFDRILIQEKRVQLQDPFSTANQDLQEKHCLILDLYSENGHHVQSECVAGDWPGYSHESVDHARICLEQRLIPEMIGQAYTHPSEIHAILNHLSPDTPMARAAIEMGAWALAAKEAGKNLDDYIEGSEKYIPVGLSFGIQPSLRTLINKLKQAESEGYQRAKLKITPDTALITLEAIKQAKIKLPIMVDANGSFSEETWPILKDLDQYHLQMIEQPFKKEDWRMSVYANERMRTPICLDESIRSLEDLAHMVLHKTGKIITVKPGCLGGFTPTFQLMEEAKKHHIPMWVGGMLETEIGKRYLVALASKTEFTYPGDLISQCK